MTSYFLNWLSPGFPLLMLKCPFLSEKRTFLNCFLSSNIRKPLVLPVNSCVHYRWLLPGDFTVCVCSCASLTQYAALTDFTDLTSNLLSSKLDFHSSVSMLTYLLPFHHLQQGYPEADSTFIGTRGREGGVGGPGFAGSYALIDLV